MKKEYILDRLEKAIYMGFLLDKKSNDYLGEKYHLNLKMVEEYISNYNKSISKKGYPINLTFNDDKLDLQIRTLGEFVYLNEDDLYTFIKNLECKINNNLSHALKSYTNNGIEIYDLDLLVELKISGVTTMGDTYLAFNNKKYTMHFSHLYRVV